MIKEAIDRILQLAEPSFISMDGIAYSKDKLSAIMPGRPDSVTIHTLNGLSELIGEHLEGIGSGLASTSANAAIQPPSDPTAKDIFLLIESPVVVKMLSLRSDKFGRRTQFALAESEPCGFQFGQFLNPEQFILGLQAHFVPSVGDTDYVLRLVSNLSSEAVATAEDDGVSQKVAVRKGVVLKDTETVKSRVKLAPYRTFREVDQPQSDFILRLRTRENEPPVCGLFEGDGGKWKIDAVAAVAAWLSRNTTDIAVVS